MKIIKVEFSVGQKVQILELTRPGVVLGIYTTERGTTYEVRYFWEGDPNTVYFYEWELAPYE